MRKYLTGCLAISAVLILSAWGYKGHRITALVAEDYLTPQAKQAVKAILGNETLVDVSTWADEVKNDPQYRKTASWHFLNLPLGLSYQDFVKAIYSQSKDNVSSAILSAEGTLSDNNASISNKREALKFLVHLVGDAHQPMHISRAEDKGGNTIQVRFDGKGTNLHSLWDSKLIDHEGLSESELKQKVEAEIKSSDIKAYQADKPTKWLYESYTSASKLYQDVDKNNSITEQQYQSYIKLVHQRLAAGGLRLAGVLNTIFANAKLTDPVIQMTKDTISYKASEPVNHIKLQDVSRFMGKLVSIEGKVYSSKDMGSMILINLGAAYPNQLLTVVLRGEAKSKGIGIDGKSVRVEGKLIDYKGKPEIIVTEGSSFKLL